MARDTAGSSSTARIVAFAMTPSPWSTLPSGPAPGHADQTTRSSATALPPSTTSTCPVVYAEPGVHSIATTVATSSGLPPRPTGRDRGLAELGLGLARGRDPARGDHVAGDPVGGMVDGDGARQPRHPGLRRGVGRLPAHRHQGAGHRGHHHHPAPPRGHQVGQDRARHQERRVQVARDRQPPRLGRHPQHGARLGTTGRLAQDRRRHAGHAGVVDQHADRPEGLAHLRDGPLRRRLVGQVGHHTERLDAEPGEVGGAVVGAFGRGGDPDPSAERAQQPGAGEADAVGRARSGDQRRTAAQVEQGGQRGREADWGSGTAAA